MLGGSADTIGKPIPVPVAHASTAASTTSRLAKSAPVAPLRGLKQADLLVVAPFSLSSRVRAAVARQSGVTGTEPIEAAKIKINGAFTAVLGVDPSSFRGYAAPSTAASSKLWQGVASGGVAVSYTMGTLDKLSLGRTGHRVRPAAATAAGGGVRHGGHRRGRRGGIRFGRPLTRDAGQERDRGQRAAGPGGLARDQDQGRPAPGRVGRAAGHRGDAGRAARPRSGPSPAPRPSAAP